MSSFSFVIQQDTVGKRLDVFVSAQFHDVSRTRVARLIEEGHVLVNDQRCKTSYKLEANDHVSVDLPEPIPDDARPESMELDIIYEDQDILIVNKPRGMTVHPAPGHPSGTLVNGLLAHCGSSLSGINGVMRPGIVHRIDKETSGLLVVCKNDQAHHHIAAQLYEHSILRLYQGITEGIPDPRSGTIRGAIARSKRDRKKMAIVYSGGKEAVTHYQVEEEMRGHALCSFRLETGRTHQIRVHMASIHHPLYGDTVYGKKRPSPYITGQALHAGTLGLIHPTTGKYMEFHAPLPADMLHCIQMMKLFDE